MKRKIGYFSLLAFFISISCNVISNIGSQPSNVEPTQLAIASPTESAPRIDWLTFTGTGDTTVNGIAQDKKGNVYMLEKSQSDGNGHVELSLIKVSQSGKVTWHTLVTSDITNSNATLVVDQDNNIYVASNTDQSWGNPLSAFNPNGDQEYGEVFVAKINEQGSVLWNTFIGGNHESTMAIDKNNIIYILTLGGHDENPVLVKLNSDGQVLHTKPLVSGASNYSYNYATLNIDKNGNLYTSGAIGKAINEMDLFVSKYSNDGELIWETTIGGEGTQDYHYVGQTQISLDSNGDIFLHGYSNASFGIPLNPFDGGYDHKPDSTGYGYEDGFEDFIAKLDNNGNILWNTFLNKTDGIFNISLQENGNLVLVGWQLNPNDPKLQKRDCLVHLMDKNGLIKSSFHLGADGYAGIYNLITIQYPYIYVSGISNVSFGNPITPIKSPNSPDTFLAKIYLP